MEYAMTENQAADFLFAVAMAARGAEVANPSEIYQKFDWLAFVRVIRTPEGKELPTGKFYQSPDTPLP